MLRTRAVASVTVGTLLSVSVLIGCTNPGLPEIHRGQQARHECPSGSGRDFYFPEGTYGEFPDGPTLGVEARLLSAMNAPSFSCGSAPDERYRLVFVHSFGDGIVLTATESTRAWTFQTVVFKHPRTIVGRDPREIPYPSSEVERRFERSLSAPEGELFAQTLKETEFWNMEGFHDSRASDGASWTIEGRSELAYHVVTRVNPDDSAFPRLARLIFSLAKMDVPYR